jgi:Tat protein secretion system quality control protein TatD with DNase activity
MERLENLSQRNFFESQLRLSTSFDLIVHRVIPQFCLEVFEILLEL